MFLIFQNHTQKCGNIIFHAFDPVTVRLSLDSTNVQHEKLVFQLVKPYIEGFSVKTISDQLDDENVAKQKRKTADKKEEEDVKQKKKKMKK